MENESNESSEVQDLPSRKRSRVVTLNPDSRPPKKSTKPPRLGLITDEPHVTMIVGKKKSGKSHLFCELLLDPQGYNKKYDRIIFISPTFRTQYEKLWKALDPKG